MTAAPSAKALLFDHVADEGERAQQPVSAAGGVEAVTARRSVLR